MPPASSRMRLFRRTKRLARLRFCRDLAARRAFWSAWPNSNPVYGDAATGTDIEAIKALVAAQLGDEQKALFEYWLARFPDELVAIRDA